jgi:PAS domain S-box-containing protein
MSVTPRVLVISDSETRAAAVLGALRAAGHTVTVHSPGSAETLEGTLSELWGVILYLAAAPGATDALGMLCARREPPVIVLTSNSADAESIAAAHSGAYDCISADAVAHIRSAVERALREAELRQGRQRAEAALRASEQRFAQVFEYAPIAMTLVTTHGTIIKANPAMCEMFGYSESEMAEMPVWRVTHPDDLPQTVEQLRRLLDGEIDTWFLEKRYFHRDGHLLWGRSTTWLVRDAGGTPQYVVSQVQDITEWKRMQEHTRLQQAELAHVLRVATMGETVAQIAHEVNQPLASIANFANGLVTRLTGGSVDPATTRLVAAEIANEAMRASEVIRRLRDFLRKGEPKLVRCDANEVVRDALRLVEPDIRQHTIRLALGLAPHPLPVDVDRVQVEQVVLNLLRNAVDAMAAQPAGARDLLVDTKRRAGDEVTVRVRDTGVGLPDLPEHDIFEPFFTTKRDGLGLGLSISRSIIQAHGGNLWALRNAGRGATVGFNLPLAAV